MLRAISNYYYRGKDIKSVKKEYVNSFDLIGRGIYIPLSVFQKIGLFDEKRFKQCGDTELPLRARLAGYNLIVSFKAIVYDMPELTAAIDVKEYYTYKDFKNVFFELSTEKKIIYIENALLKDSTFRNSLKDMIVGLFTVEEYNVYTLNASALNKRMVGIIKERLISHIQLLTEMRPKE